MPMASPQDVAEFVSDLLMKAVDGSPVYELEGPEWLSSEDVAATLSAILGRLVTVQQLPHEKWGDQLRQTGFTS